MRNFGGFVVAASILNGVLGCSGGGQPKPTPVVEVPRGVEGTADGEAGDGVSEQEAARQQRRIARTLAKVSAVRGLDATREVPGKTLSREKLLARVKQHVATEIPTTAIRNEGLVLKLMGFLPPVFDYEAETFALLEAQLAGYYEPADHTMYMAADLDDDNAHATLAHELVHALQDHHWDLASRSKYKPGQGDASSARAALAEGDATSAMLDVLIAETGRTALDVPPQLFSEQILTSMDKGPGASAPHVMRASLVAPYIDGTLFVHALRRKGGWKAVDAAWADPPTTTEQILHLEKYEKREPAIDVPPPTFAALGAGWSVQEADTYGELGTRLAFAEWMDAPKAEKAAAHWGGDRGVLLQKGENEFAFAWRLRYDRPEAAGKDASAFATDAHAALLAALEAKIAPATKQGAACMTRKDLGPVVLLRKGRDLVFVVGPTTVEASGASKPASTCAALQKWMTELAAATPAP